MAKIRVFDAGFGTVSAVSCERVREKQRPTSSLPILSAPTEESADITEEIETRISFSPKLGFRKQGFQASFRQHHSHRSTYQAMPRLFVNNVLPYGSPVFEV